MKKHRMGILILGLVCLLFTGCQFDSGDVSGETAINLINEKPIGHITKIKISALPAVFHNTEITAYEEIEKIADYFNGINPFDTEKDHLRYYGGAYTLRFFYDDGITNTIFLECNRFIVIDERPALELTYEDASYFGVVIGYPKIIDTRGSGALYVQIGEKLEIVFTIKDTYDYRAKIVYIL
jgi:hypothetical protein